MSPIKKTNVKKVLKRSVLKKQTSKKSVSNTKINKKVKQKPTKRKASPSKQIKAKKVVKKNIIIQKNKKTDLKKITAKKKMLFKKQHLDISNKYKKLVKNELKQKKILAVHEVKLQRQLSKLQSNIKVLTNKLELYKEKQAKKERNTQGIPRRILKRKQMTRVDFPHVDVSNYPKYPIKKIILSQPKPENDKSPYHLMAMKYNLDLSFKQFIKIESYSVREFKHQKIDVLAFSSIIFTSKLAVDYFFKLMHEMRIVPPTTMKYFCINETIAFYLQKYIQYRKRKVFYGYQSIEDLVNVIYKHASDKYLIPLAEVHKEAICEFLDKLKIEYTKAIMYRSVSENMAVIPEFKNINNFDLLVFFTPAGIESLTKNYPNFNQGRTRIACFGPLTAQAIKKHNYRLDIYAPNAKHQSITSAIDDYIKEANNKKK